MGYAQDSGYTPADIETIMADIMDNINTQFELDPAYTMETFVGTNFYKYFYALAQKYQGNEIKTSEIFQKLQVYFDQINARIARPVVTNPGIVEKFLAEGYTSSVKPPADADAGKVFICVDVDDGTHATGLVTITDYAKLVSGTDDVVTIEGVTFTAQAGAAPPGDGTFQAATSNVATALSLATQINAHATIGLLVKARAAAAKVFLEALDGGTGGNAIDVSYTDNDSNVGLTLSGLSAGKLSGGATNAGYAALKTAICTLISQITVGGTVSQGTESEAIVLSNGQSFDFKYYKPNLKTVHLRLTIDLSENNQVVVGSPDDIKNALIENITEKYLLGRNFEPQRYFSVVDAPWAASVLLEYSFNYDESDSGSATWNSAIYDADYRDLFDIKLENVLLVET